MANTTFTPEEFKVIAETILAQLGGGRFALMTGAKHFIALNDGCGGLYMSLPSKLTERRIARMKIELTPADTYTVTTYTKHLGQWGVVDKREDVYAEDLEPVFESMTGLYTHL